MNPVFTSLESPLGLLYLTASSAGMHSVRWADTGEMNLPPREDAHPVLNLACAQLREYFAGVRTSFDLPLSPEGTVFQKQAWELLRRIPYGRTITYLEQAEILGDRKKTRAVGSANARNPLLIVVPCHRVIAKNGNLQGFAGGLARKKALLELESKNAFQTEAVC